LFIVLNVIYVFVRFEFLTLIATVANLFRFGYDPILDAYRFLNHSSAILQLSLLGEGAGLFTLTCNGIGTQLPKIKASPGTERFMIFTKSSEKKGRTE